MIPFIEKSVSGLTVIYQQVPEISSASYALVFGAGLSIDDSERVGESLALANLAGRQAGKYSARDFQNFFDAKGINHGESASLESFSYSGSVLADNLSHALEWLSLMFYEPNLNTDTLEATKAILTQEVQSIEDEPMRKAFQEFSYRYFSSPYNRPATGELSGIANISVADLERLLAKQQSFDRAVLSVVSNQDFSEVIDIVNSFFSRTVDQEIQKAERRKENIGFREHLKHDSQQIQIIVGMQAPKLGDEDYYLFKVLNGVLSGGMFGRLFLEVREKRGLCYSVFSSYTAQPEYGKFTCYAGTTTQRAKETLEVMLSVLNELKGSITEDEIPRVKTDLLSSLIIRQETSAAKAVSAASDWRNFNRVREANEIKERIMAITVEQLESFLSKYDFSKYSLLTLGEQGIQGDKTCQ